MSATADVTQAWLVKWNASTLTTLVPGGITTDYIKFSLPEVDRLYPHAVLVVTPYQNQTGRHGCYFDYRRVTVIVRAKNKDSLSQVVKAIHDTFNFPNQLDYSFNPQIIGGYIMPERIEDLEQTISQKTDINAKFIEQGTLAWVVKTQRLEGHT